jgi:hypothetical protein
MDEVKRCRSSQIARRYNISRTQAIDWFHEGILPAIQIGKTTLFDPLECDVALESYKRLRGKTIK